jgi:hypothetical protein
VAITSKTSRPLTKWQIIRRFQSLLRRFRSEGKLTLGEAHALAVLPEFMGDDGAMFPSHEAMAEKSGACRRTVINALNRAYALGIVKHTPRYVYDRDLGKRVRTSNAYEIVLLGIQQVSQAARYFMRTVRDHLSARPAQERPSSSFLRPERVFQSPQMSRSDMIEWCLKAAKAT